VERFDFYHAAIFLIDEANPTEALLQASAGGIDDDQILKGERLRVGSNTAVGQALGPRRKPCLVDYDSLKDIRLKNPYLPDTKSELALPLNSVITEQGSQVLGALTVHSTAPQAFSKDDVAILESMASQLAVALSNARSYLRSEREKSLNKVLREIDRRIINPEHSMNDVLEYILNCGCELIGGESGQFFLIEGEDELTVKVATDDDDLGRSVPMIVGTVIGDAIFQDHVLIADLKTKIRKDQPVEYFGQNSIDYRSAFNREKRSWVAVDIHEEDRIPVGVFSIEHAEPNQFSQEDVSTLFALAGQAAIAIKDRKLREQAEVRRRHLAATAQVGADIISLLNLDTLLERTSNLIREKLNLSQVGIYLVEVDQTSDEQKSIKLRAKSGSDVNHLSEGNSPIETNSQSTIGMVGLTVDTGQPQIAEVPIGLLTISKMTLPLLGHNEILGALEVQSISTQFSDADTQTLQNLADQLATAIHNARLYERNETLLREAERRAALLKTAALVSQSVISIFDLDTLLNKIVNTICDEFERSGFHHATVFLRDEGGEYVEQRSQTKMIDPNKMMDHRFHIQDDVSIVSAVISRGQGLVELDLESKDEAYRENLLLPEAQSEMALPLRTRDEVIGALTVHSRHKDAFTNEDIQTLQLMADQLAIAIDNASKQDRLLEAETWRGIGEATSQTIHWVANQVAPINYWINKLEQHLTPMIRQDNVDEDVKEDYFEAIKTIKHNGDKIMQIKMGRLGTARDLDVECIQLDEILEDLIKNLGFVNVEKQVSPEVSRIRGDRTAIEEVFRNLFVNATHAMADQPTPRLSIMAEKHARNGLATVRISDNGKGIPKEIMEDIWKPFYTTKADSGGTGVGLSYCRQAIEKMGGKIEVNSALNQGTTFIVSLQTCIDA
ncbi:MAG: GAF domain-containing protein, partial [Chloroflexota bacterium]